MVARVPQDRKPPAKKAVRQRASTRQEINQTTAMVAEVDNEITDAVIVEQWGHTFAVKPAGQWRQSANDGIRTGDFNTWASSAMSAVDYATWLRLDPTNDEVNAFFAEMGRVAGVSLGESELASPVLRRMARR